MIFQMNRLIAIGLGVVLLLCIPLVAMQFTAEVDWSGFDFIVMGTLLFGTGLLIDVVLRKAKTTARQLAWGAAVVAIFVLIWAELAVGIFGTPFAGS